VKWEAQISNGGPGTTVHPAGDGPGGYPHLRAGAGTRTALCAGVGQGWVELAAGAGRAWDVRLPDVLERQELSLNLLSKRAMSLILENIFSPLNIFRRLGKFLNILKIVHLRNIDYVEH